MLDNCKNFLDIKNLDKLKINKIFSLASSELKNNCLKNKTIGLMFDNPSTRTRISFIRAIQNLKGNYIEIDPSKLNLSRYETLEDTAKMLSLYLDGFIFRSNSYKKLDLFKNNFDKPIINAMTDLSHPCQAISDYYTLINHFKKNKIKIIWFGDITNVLISLIQLSEIFKKLIIHIVTSKNIVNEKQIIEKENIKIHHSVPYKYLDKFDCVMTDTFTSMNDKFSKKKMISLKQFQVNNKIMNLTNNSCVFMHCLPAKVGSEVSDDVINGKKSIILKQAENKMIVQKGLLKWLNI